MQLDTSAGKNNRPLTHSERKLAAWMLQHGTPEAKQFLAQLKLAEVTPWRCKCGCATIQFQIKGMPKAPPGVHILADFVFGDEKSLSGIMIFASKGILSSIEVYALANGYPTELPTPEELRVNSTAA